MNKHEKTLFVGLQKIENSQNLQGSFEAFKFSTTSLVRFQVSVKFCVGECLPVNCDDGVVSFGRRRRRETGVKEEENVIIYDDRLNQEILDIDTDLVKEIFVESGTVVDRLSSSEQTIPYPAHDAVYIRGEHVEDRDIICTSWAVVLAASAGVVFLQLCILATCLTCLYTSHRQMRYREKHCVVHPLYPHHFNER